MKRNMRKQGNSRKYFYEVHPKASYKIKCFLEEERKMKKSLVLAMAMALGVTASAYAANPFSDVPAGHWAYDSVNKLAAAGVVDGYPDGTYGGDKLMTRYEMAQIVAKAMAKGANVDKLAAEFADELDTLGVRVANLEAKADNVKVTGQIRYHYADHDDNGYETKLRSRIWVNGQINDDWSYTGMLENQQDFKNDAGEENTKFQRAYVNGKLGGTDIQAGRQQLFLVGGNLYDTRFDGIQASYGEDVKFSAFYGKPTNQKKDMWSWTNKHGVENYRELEYDNVYGAKVDAKIGVVKATVGYTVFGDANSTKYVKGKDGFAPSNDKYSFDLDDNEIWNAGVAFDLAKDLEFTADYMKSNGYDGDFKQDLGDDAYILGLSYQGAKASEVGSWGLYAKYYDQDRTTVVAHTMNGDYGSQGFKGYMVGANYTFAKNIVGSVEYYDLESKEIGDSQYPSQDLKTLWSQLVFTF